MDGSEHIFTYNTICPLTLPLNGLLVRGTKICITFEVHDVLDRDMIVNFSENNPRNVMLQIRYNINGQLWSFNSMEDSQWDGEEMMVPLKLESKLILRPLQTHALNIVIQNDAYKISLDETPLITFRHRLDFARVNRLFTDGPVTIKTFSTGMIARKPLPLGESTDQKSTHVFIMSETISRHTNEVEKLDRGMKEATQSGPKEVDAFGVIKDTLRPLDTVPPYPQSLKEDKPDDAAVLPVIEHVEVTAVADDTKPGLLEVKTVKDTLSVPVRTLTALEREIEAEIERRSQTPKPVANEPLNIKESSQLQLFKPDKPSHSPLRLQLSNVSPEPDPRWPLFIELFNFFKDQIDNVKSYLGSGCHRS